MKIKLAQVEEERMIFSNEASCLSLKITDHKREKASYLEVVMAAAKRESFLEAIDLANAENMCVLMITNQTLNHFLNDKK
ncbi:hypothetical protein HAX54_035995, partial [Datura stramonium]|nr:hypothetical protein [Datura stramonium]